MSTIPTSAAIRLGMLVEYLRGISSVSVSPNATFEELSELRANLPASRYRVADVTSVIRDLLEKLKEFDLKKSLGVINDLEEKQEEMVNFLETTNDPDGAYLLDIFANDLIVIANDIGDAILEETAE